MPQAEITIKFLGTNKKNAKYGFIVSSEGDTYGCMAEHLKQFSTGQIYTIQYHVNDRGYKEFDAITSKPLVKQNIRPATPEHESDRMGTMGMVNGVLNGWSYGRPLHEIVELLEKNPDLTARLIGALHESLMRSVIKGKQVQHRDDLNDEIPFP